MYLPVNSPAPLRVYLITWLVLMGQLAATLALAYLRLGALKAPFMLAILFTLSGTDYLTRIVAPAPWTTPAGH